MNDFNTARRKIGGLKGVMRALGDAPDHDHKWKNFSNCPFCGAKDCSGVWEKDGAEFFKCHKPGCNSGNAVMTEVGYIAAREGLSETALAEDGASPAYERFLKLAGCWEEPPAKAAKTELKPELVAAARELVIEQQSAALRLLKTELNVGQEMAFALLAELEKQGVVGPARERQPREVLIKSEASGGAPVAEPTFTVKQRLEAVEAVRWMEKAETRSASVDGLMKFLKWDAALAAALMAAMERDGLVGPAAGADPAAGREILKLPEPPPETQVVCLNGDLHVEFSPEVLARIEPPSARVSPTAIEEVAPGLKALRWFLEQLPRTNQQMTPYLEDGSPVPDPLPAAVVKQLKFKPVSMFVKRGLTCETCRALGFRANPVGNEALLHEVLTRFGWLETVASGLWLPADPRRKLDRRVNQQFCGKGQIGRKPESERLSRDDKSAWGPCAPMLIPYFDALGKLIKLRPHKAGAPVETAAGSEHIYVPRVEGRAGDVVEKFDEVVICEGEFKAAAIWQTVGAGAANDLECPLEFPPFGVCSFPGISFAKNVALRDELADWLQEVGAKKVYVAFDDEDGSHKPLRQRHGAQIYARYLAADLNRKSHVNALVCTLPREWRNAKGKSDWDGRLAELYKDENDI